MLVFRTRRKRRQPERLLEFVFQSVTCTLRSLLISVAPSSSALKGGDMLKNGLIYIRWRASLLLVKAGNKATAGAGAPVDLTH